MKSIASILFGFILGALAILIARRSESGSVVVDRIDESLNSFISGVQAGLREQSH